MSKLLFSSFAAILGVTVCTAQTDVPAQSGPAPIYRVTVVSRTLEAVNYEHRSGPTTIGFQGTVLLPQAKGDAIVESKRGRLEIHARFEHMAPPTRFGPEYLTYVLWAITPEGRAKSLGEVMPNSSNKAKIDVTTDLQAVGLMVTAEPYYSVGMPSDVVVAENVILPDTIGKREVVTAKYELLPRGRYTMVVNTGVTAQQRPEEETQKLPYDRYEALLEVYEAQNAVQMAQAMGADQYAADIFGKAENLLQEAQRLNASKGDTHLIVSEAREAAQTAEDARAITERRRSEEARLSAQRQQGMAERQAISQAEADAQAARDQAASEHEEAESRRAAAEQAQAEAAQAQALAAQREREAQAAAAEAVEAKQAQALTARKESRAELMTELNAILPTRDTPRGLCITVPDAMVSRSDLSARLSRIATLVSSHPGLTVHVEGYSDDHGSEADTQRHAQAVADMLIASGVPAGSITAAGYGRERPLASNATASGREENRRVELIVTGQTIGDTALWDHPYSIGGGQTVQQEVIR
jgi:outer membrane protein OmpA-like peptidoglycan-associated protein